MPRRSPDVQALERQGVDFLPPSESEPFENIIARYFYEAISGREKENDYVMAVARYYELAFLYEHVRQENPQAESLVHLERALKARRDQPLKEWLIKINPQKAYVIDDGNGIPLKVSTKNLPFRIPWRLRWIQKILRLTTPHQLLVLHRLAAGGIGTVSVAFSSKRAGLVAVKSLKHTPDISLLKTMKEEAQTTDKAAHPYVLSMIDVKNVPQDNPQGHIEMILVMPLVEGKNILQLAEENDVSLGDFGEWICKIAEALENMFYHPTHPVLYRDLKPQNVVIDTHNQPYLIDFGLAIDIENDSGGTARGTYQYASPEEWTGHATLNSGTWNLAVMVYEFLFHAFPYSDSSVRELEKKARNFSFQGFTAAQKTMLEQLTFTPDQMKKLESAFRQAFTIDPLQRSSPLFFATEVRSTLPLNSFQSPLHRLQTPAVPDLSPTEPSNDPSNVATDHEGIAFTLYD